MTEIEPAPVNQDQLINPLGSECFDYHQIKLDLKEQRVNWPRLSTAATADPRLCVYTKCKAMTSYNMLGPRAPIKTCNNIGAWESHVTGHPDDAWIVECVSFGFPLQYRGPPLLNEFLSNHPSATNFDYHVRKYIDTETKLGVLIGPFDAPPFVPWCHIAPLMSREKADKAERRIIVDLSFPPDNGPNAFITKNSVFGKILTHALPTVQQAIDVIIQMDFNLTLGSIDIERAYHNFALDPLDWPLVCISYPTVLYRHCNALR